MERAFISTPLIHAAFTLSTVRRWSRFFNSLRNSFYSDIYTLRHRWDFVTSQLGAN